MANQIQATGAVKIRSLTGALTASAGVVTSVPLGGANGVATLDSLGKVPLSQLPASVVTYLGTWNAATNTPTLANGTGDVGDLYICNVAGTVNFGAGPITFAVGDWVIYSGTTWQRSSGASGTVTSVAATVPTGLTVTGSPITTSGTLAFGLTAGYTIPLSTQLVPSGGTAGQLLAKNSATNYDTVWIDNYTEQLRDTVKAAVAINKGQAVYISGANGTNQIVSLASNASEATSSKTLGLAAQNFAINDIGQIITEGLLAGIDTSTATAGDPVWLGVDGNLIFGLTNKPVAPAHLVYIGVVTRVQAINGEIYIKIQNGFELQELHNVLITSPANNQGIFYDSATSLWKNKSIASALGYTPADDSLVVHLAGTETITGTKTFTATSTKFSKIRIDNTTLAQSDTIAFKQYASGSIGESGNTSLSAIGANQFNINFGGTKTIILDATNLTTDRTYLFPDSNGTVALTSDLSSYVPYTGATGDVNLGFNILTTLQAITNGVFINQLTGAANSINLETATSAIAIGGTGYVSLLSNATDSLSIYFSNTTKVAKFLGSGLTAKRTYTLPDASGTVALTSQLTGGTVTSVAALTLGTTGTDLSSTVATGTTTPVITLNVPTASATNRGALSSADWTTFNNKQNALTNPVTGTGTTNTLPKFTGTSAIGNSNITDTGSLITLGSNSYVNGSLGIGTSTLTTYSLRVSKNITGGTTARGLSSDGTVQSDVTVSAVGVGSALSTAAASFTLTNLYQFYSGQVTIGAGSTVTNQYGYHADATLIGATNNYGFRGAIPAGTNRWNIYMDGTANNYLAGSLGIGSTSLTGRSLVVSKNMTGATGTNGIRNDGQIQSDATSTNAMYNSVASTAAASFTTAAIVHYYAQQGTFGAGSTVSAQYGFIAEGSLIGAGSNFGFYGNIASGTNRWNLYMNGTAANYIAGNTGIGILPSYKLDVQDANANGIVNVSSFSVIGNGASGRGVGILIGAGGSASSVQVARLVGYQEATSATANAASFAIQVANSSGTLTERVRVKTGGQMRFVPLAADPTGAEAGDIYYNSTSNALKLYDGTQWRTITVV